MEKLVLGMDVGGSKSHLSLHDSSGNKINFAEWGTLNHECMEGSFEQLECELGQFILPALKQHELTPRDVEYSVFGFAGVDTKQQNIIVSKMLKKLGFVNFTLCNDAFLGIPAAVSDSVGICAINGTGSTIAGIGPNGKMLQIGGVGPLSDDKGGGSEMGRAMIASVYRSLFRGGEATILTELLFNELNISSKYDFTDALAQKISDGTFRVGAANRLIFQAAEQSDKVALKLLSDVAENYVGGISCMINELEFAKNDNVHIVLAGSVFVKSEHPALLDSLKSNLIAQNPDYCFDFTILTKPPVAGAVIWALTMLGAENSAKENAYLQY